MKFGAMKFSHTFKTLWAIFSKYRWHISSLVVLGFVTAILEGLGINIAIPLFSFIAGGQAPTDFVSTTVQNLFRFFSIPFIPRYLFALILLLFILRSVASVVFGYVRGWINADFVTTESEALLKGTLSASWPFLLKQKIGTLQNTLIRDVQRTGELLSSLSQTIQSFTGFLMYLVVALNISPLTTFYTILGGIVLVFIMFPLQRKSREAGGAMVLTEKRISQFMAEHIIGMKAIKAAAAEKKAYEDGKKSFRDLRNYYVKLAFIRAVGGSVFQPFSIIFITILFVLTYHTPGFSLISFAATLYLIQKIFTYLESGQGAFNLLNELVPYAENIMAFKKILTTHKESGVNGKNSFVFKNNLTFKDVSFSYNTEKPVLSDVSFSVAHGETVGLIGPSGAGKTSVADLLLRLFTPSSGTITLNGVSIDTISTPEWREHVGYVSQDIFLFNESVKENISFYRNDLSDEDIINAAKQANIFDFIETLENGFDTIVGDRGVMLSGGQRQRVVLARALARKPELLILDEATSALDAESERLIQEAIKALHGTMTVFIIAHRLSTVESVDMIFVLDHGRIMEKGSPRELKTDTNSYFYRMQHNLDEEVAPNHA